MGADLNMEPWSRMAKLCPPNTPEPDLQVAADRWFSAGEVYNAAADVWEEKLLAIELNEPDQGGGGGAGEGSVSSISQDGITVSYAVNTDVQNPTVAKYARMQQIKNIIRSLRKRGKPVTAIIHGPDYNPWSNRARWDDEEPEIIIPIINPGP